MSFRALTRLAVPALATVATSIVACSSAPQGEGANVTDEAVTQAVSWDIVPGCAREIAVGGGGFRNDDVWVLGCESAPGGFAIYHRLATDDGWTKINGGALKIAVDVNGQPWIVNRDNKLLRGVLSSASTATWTDQQAPCAVDVTVGLPLAADGRPEVSGSLTSVTPWILGCTRGQWAQEIYRYAPKMVAPDRARPGQNWDLVTGNLDTIRMFPYDTLPHGVADGQVFAATGTSSSSVGWTRLAGCASEIAVGVSYVGAIVCGDPGDKDIYLRPKSQPDNWDRFYGRASKIAQASMYTWVLSENGTAFRLHRGNWKNECGFQGEAPCSDSKNASVCNDHLTPVNGVCTACGTAGAPGCATGNACDPGLSVFQAGGVCKPCGADQGDACNGGNAPCENAAYEADTYGKCNPIWGRQGERCEPHGNVCRGVLSCYAGICSTHVPVEADGCGGNKESCCDTSTNTRQCLAGYHCGQAGIGASYLCYPGGGEGGGGNPPPACSTGSTTVCGESCPSGTHITEWATAQGDCAKQNHEHQVKCAQDCGTVLDTCGTTCPPSYHATRSDCIGTCGICHDNGNGAPQSNHQYCALN